VFCALPAMNSKSPTIDMNYVQPLSGCNNCCGNNITRTCRRRGGKNHFV